MYKVASLLTLTHILVGTKQGVTRNDKLFDELKKYGIEDLHELLSENGVDESMVWNITKEEIQNNLRMKLGHERRYWEAKRQKNFDDVLATGSYGNSNSYRILLTWSKKYQTIIIIWNIISFILFSYYTQPNGCWYNQMDQQRYSRLRA